MFKASENSTREQQRTDLAIFVATSGHSGVDRIIANLLPEFSKAGLQIDLLRVRNHGPWITELPPRVRAIDLQRRHVTQCLNPLIRYLRDAQPRVLLSDKDRANRTALRARRRAGSDTRCFVRLGTTVSANLANKGILDAWIERRSLRRYSSADGVIVPSRGAADDLAKTAGLSRDHIHVLPNPVVTPAMEEQTAKVSPAPHPWLADDAELPVIMACGSLTQRKDYATLLHAFAQTRQQRPSNLLILGCGSEHAQLVRLSRELDIHEHVDFPGFVDDPIPWMQRASVFAHTSRWEGLGIVLIEALACGLPVVAMDCPSGPAEILDGGRIGTLVALGDTSAFATALLDELSGDRCPDTAIDRAREFRVDIAAQAYLATLGFAPHHSRAPNA
jgi:glycosyltransferase involved in cell wall biosynthesis